MPISRLQLSPYQILFGREMPINTPGPTTLAVPFTGDKESYYCWLAREIKYNSTYNQKRHCVKVSVCERQITCQ